MVITKYVKVDGAPSTNECNGAEVGSLVGSISDVAWMIDGFVRDTEVKSVEKIIEGLEGTDVAVAFNATEGSNVELELFVGSIVESLLQVASNVDIVIGSSVIIS